MAQKLETDSRERVSGKMSVQYSAIHILVNVEKKKRRPNIEAMCDMVADNSESISSLLSLQTSNLLDGHPSSKLRTAIRSLGSLGIWF